MVKKYTFINTALERSGNSLPMYRVFNTDSGEVGFEAYVFGKKLQIVDRFYHVCRSKVVKWRKAAGKIL